MKRMLLAGLVIALTALSCENVMNNQTTEEAKPQIVGYTDDGAPIMRVRVSVSSNSRALTETMAKSGVIDYYEAAFREGSNAVVRGSWGWAGQGSIDIPGGDYADTNVANFNNVLFAGREKDKMLVAVGKLAKVNGVASAVIDTSTTEIQFEMYPLVTNLTGNGAESSLQITTPTPPGYTNPTTLPLASDNLPYYKVAPSQVNTASWKVDIGTGTWSGGGLPTSKLSNYIVRIAPDYSKSSIFARSSSLNGSSTAVTLDPIAARTIAWGGTTGSNTEFPHNGKFNLSFTTPVNNGYIDIALAICVYPLKDDVGHEWYIRGGYDNSILDDATNTSTATGGAMRLLSGNKPTGSSSAPISIPNGGGGNQGVDWGS